MEEWKALLENVLNKELEGIIFSNSCDKEAASRIKIRPVLIGGELKFQETLYRGTKVFHSNYSMQEMTERALGLLPGSFRQVEITTLTRTAIVLVSKKGKITIKQKNRQAAVPKELSHNRVKQYILPEGHPVDFLVGLGVQTPDGKVVKAKYDKFRQINRYLEFIEDVLKELPTDRTIRIVDFGCGKSYLTFAMYYYLHEMQGRDILVTGLDLKEDVIDHCNELAGRCGFTRLYFEKGDISTYEGVSRVDMVVSLHACDTATDYALYKAMKWGAKVIMAVPCCQHEVNKQIRCPELSSLLQFGVIKERMSALITDALRARLLIEQGYDTQILEFIDMEHTPKNLLIRAVKHPKMRVTGRLSDRDGAVGQSDIRIPSGNDVSALLTFLNISPTLARLLEVSGERIEIDEENNH